MKIFSFVTTFAFGMLIGALILLKLHEHKNHVRWYLATNTEVKGDSVDYMPALKVDTLKAFSGLHFKLK